MMAAGWGAGWNVFRPLQERIVSAGEYSINHFIIFLPYVCVQVLLV